jgi:hypothetical protein
VFTTLVAVWNKIASPFVDIRREDCRVSLVSEEQIGSVERVRML